MRISPINNNFAKNTGNKIVNKVKNLGFTKSLLIGATIIAGTSFYINRDEWAFITKTIKEDISGNIRQKPLKKNFDSYESAINYGCDRIVEHMKKENKEYSIYINNKNNEIISEYAGTDSSVVNFPSLKMYTNKIFNYGYSYTRLHGHPQHESGATGTFSFTDFKTFISDDFCTEDYVFNIDKKYCRFTKTENYKKPNKKELAQLEDDYNRMLQISKLKQKTIKTFQGETLFEIVDMPAMHSFWDRMCKKFGIQYVTTYGTYGIYEDIYQNGYYEAFIDDNIN